MFNQTALEEYYQRQNISYEAQRIINHIRTSDPSRLTASGMYNVACRYPSKKMKCTIQAESHNNELAAVYEWDHDCNTHEFYDQPPKIKLSYQKSEGKKVTILHTPDFFILANDYTGWIECKTEEKLTELSVTQPERYVKDELGNWRCPPGEAYAAQFGLRYSLRSSIVNDWVLLRNLVFLSDYMDADCPAPTESELQIVQGLFKDKPWMNLIDLVRADDKLPADAIYKMIVDGHLYFPIRSNPISELEYAVVYRDEVAADFYKLQACKDAVTEFNLRQPLQIKAGENLTWDGMPWKIDNVGKTSAYLSNAEGHTTQIELEDLQTYIQENKITGLPTNLSDDLQNDVYLKISAAGPKAMQAAIARYEILQNPTARTTVSISTVKYYRKKFQEAEMLYGNGLIGLFPQTAKRGNRDRKIDPMVVSLMETVIDDHYLKPHKPKFMAAYGELTNLCAEQGLVEPSEKTFRAAINKRKAYDVVLAREGKRAAYEHETFYWRLDMDTPRHGERPFDIAHIDHTELDIQLSDRLFGIMYERPWLSIMIDAYSRKVLAFWISFNSPSYHSCMMLIKRCVQQHGRIPRTIVVDGGSEFDSVYMETLLSFLKVTKKSRAKSKARFGSVLERFFGTSNTQLIHNLSGNTQATKTPRTCVPSHDPKKLTAWTLQSFTQCFASWLTQVYENNPHKGLGSSPNQVFAISMRDFGIRSHKHITYNHGFELLCMPTTKNGVAKIHRVQGIHLNYQSYWCKEFTDPALAGKKVPVRYNPDNAAYAYAYINGQWIECISEFVAIFKNRSVKQIELITQNLKAKNMLMSKKQKLTAHTIAAFLREASLSEELQRQIWRDQELLARANLESKPMQDVEQESDIYDMDTTNDQDLQVYEDF
ncbi:Mu transposase C-terminal domain-containing protein [Methylotenera mobilis]|uniref:Integrase catalytic region n=1 Tax=Methylotenera mobilis (strain JLW8 / ATCC BAA-1282 / DSM 17540) TaxID=583345 RepID=C6WTZ2_METML|nr:DDE-type integrase/transposase/recombinase [Methylotenera mobilis]ACT47391.1 Integrase catalytic region [Methylotenera mobilis JLW8]